MVICYISTCAVCTDNKIQAIFGLFIFNNYNERGRVSGCVISSLVCLDKLIPALASCLFLKSYVFQNVIQLGLFIILTLEFY